MTTQEPKRGLIATIGRNHVQTYGILWTRNWGPPWTTEWYAGPYGARRDAEREATSYAAFHDCELRVKHVEELEP